MCETPGDRHVQGSLTIEECGNGVMLTKLHHGALGRSMKRRTWISGCVRKMMLWSSYQGHVSVSKGSPFM